MDAVCPDCGLVRKRSQKYMANAKSLVCRECQKKRTLAKLVNVKCPQCGRDRLLEPRDAARLTNGTCYHCPRYKPTEAPESFDFGYVAGAVIGDGSLLCRKLNGSRAFYVQLSVTDLAFAERFRDHLAVCTGRKPSMDSRTSTKKANLAIGMPETVVTEWRVSIGSREWYDRLKPYKIDHIFDDLLGRSEDFRRGFLQGLIDAEGYISPLGYVDIANKDVDLLAVVVAVMASIGESARVHGPYPYSRGVAHLRAKAHWTKTQLPEDQRRRRKKSAAASARAVAG